MRDTSNEFIEDYRAFCQIAPIFLAFLLALAAIGWWGARVRGERDALERETARLERNWR